MQTRALTVQLFAFRYYSGEKKAPILTVFIGGNHEASNHLQELPYGGWVAPNIYYLGMFSADKDSSFYLSIRKNNDVLLLIGK